MRNDLSSEAKQSFQVVALLATILVVGVHYKTDVPDGPDPSMATLNELAQEFLFGGMARVAVPMFAFAAGFFYFRSDDGALATYLQKFRQRLRTIGVPFFIIGSIAMATWLAIRHLEGDPVRMTARQLLATWLLRPPAEQLWFLRDLMVLVIIAPVIRLACVHSTIRHALLAVVGMAWALNAQVFPIVAGWHLLHAETLLFFVLGCVAVSHTDWIESVGRTSRRSVLGVCSLWCGLIFARICLRADFDIWYTADYGWIDLCLHQTSILVGCVAVLMIAWRIRCALLIHLSGASFFVYLVHEFPLRAVVERISDRHLDHSTSCWIVTPLVLLGCFLAALLLNRFCPAVVGILTGGRTPSSAAGISREVVGARAIAPVS